jgi:DNA-binding NtrC family response regulator
VGDAATTEPAPRAAATDRVASLQDEARALKRQFRLSVHDGPDRGQSFIAAGRAVLGTHASVDLVLHDRAVSRFHCEVVIEDGRALLRDLQSTNGTLVGGVAVREAFLSDGAVLSIGNTRLVFQLGTEHVRVPISERDRFGGLVGASVPMRSAFTVLEQAAASEATVLLEGETGTGKEAAAEAIHLESARRDRPYVIVDCTAIPSELLESELFGHERGAFTGAATARQGAFASADGGTIFLDEIGELSSDLQPKLLRALERREVKRVGADRYETVDVRVIAATNRNLRAEVNAKRFRSDLYYRLAVLEVRLPPLRERSDDLPLLVEQLLKQLGAAERPEAALVRTDAFLAQLRRHPWPGNVRELRNHLERCLALRRQAPLGPSLPTAADGEAAGINLDQPLRAARDAFERRYLERILRERGGNVSAAARAAGFDRIGFYRLLWRHGLK